MGNCDDNNNNCGCEYDGGDCCAKTASASTLVHSARARVATISSKGMGTTTMTTTIAAVGTMAAIVVPKPSARRSPKNTAKLVLALTQRANRGEALLCTLLSTPPHA